MGSYGIISAGPDNDFGTTGIASDATHVAIEAVSIIVDSDRYANTLLWVGGVEPDAPAEITGVSSMILHADIISCSHGLEGDPLPGPVSEALTRLSNEGRNGRGTVIVYSAGNRNSYIEDGNDLPTHPHTIGVGNTQVEKASSAGMRK